MSDAGSNAKGRNFSLSLNLAGTDPQKVKVSVVGGKLTVSGEQMKKVKEDFGLSRYNYCGFSNDIPLDADLDLNTLKATIIDEKIIKIEASYYPEVPVAPEPHADPVGRKVPVFLKYTWAHSNTRNHNFIWTPCVLPVPGSPCDGEPNALAYRCQHFLPGTLCTDTPHSTGPSANKSLHSQPKSNP